MEKWFATLQIYRICRHPSPPPRFAWRRGRALNDDVGTCSFEQPQTRFRVHSRVRLAAFERIGVSWVGLLSALRLLCSTAGFLSPVCVY